MFELCLLWLLLFLPAQGFLVWFPGASLLLLLRFRPTNHSKTQKFLSHCVPPPAPARSLPLITGFHTCSSCWSLLAWLNLSGALVLFLPGFCLNIASWLGSLVRRCWSGRPGWLDNPRPSDGLPARVLLFFFLLQMLCRRLRTSQRHSGG